MRESWLAYRSALLKHGRVLVSGTAFGLLGIVLSIHPFVMSGWIWFLIALASVAWVGFLAFHDVRVERDTALGILTSLATRPSVSAAVKFEKATNGPLPLLRLSLTNTGSLPVPAGALINILFPASWTKFEGCTSEGLYRFGTPIKSDEDLPGEIPAMLWPYPLATPMGGKVTNLLWFRVDGDPGEHDLIVRIPAVGLNVTHTIELPAVV